MANLENSFSPYWLTIMKNWSELDEEQVESIISHVNELENSLTIARRANVVAEQKLGEALGYDITGRYPGIPQLVMQVVDMRRELLHLRSVVEASTLKEEDAGS